MTTGQSCLGKGGTTNYLEQTVEKPPQTAPTPILPDHRQPTNWKPLPLYNLESYYEVSSCGKVKNRLTGERVKTFLSKDGEFFNIYHPVTFKYIAVQIHRAVALAFVANPDGFSWVKRRDGNKHHNYAANLQWVTKGKKGLSDE